MTQPGVRSALIDEQEPFSHQQQLEIKISIASQARPKPCPDLINGNRKDYMRTVVPLFEASITGDWKAAEEILAERPELVRYSINEDGGTALHVATAAKSTKQVEEFVEHLLTYMDNSDLELEDRMCNTALGQAAAYGNIKMVKMMVEKNKALVSILNDKRMTPLHMAALLGKYDVVKYLYENSKELRDDCWDTQNRGQLLLSCVETNMFDIALNIVKRYPELGCSSRILQVLARKPEAFAETESNIFLRTINSVIRPLVGASKKESKSKALELLQVIWQNIVEKPKNEIDDILRGPPDHEIHDTKFYMPAPDKEDKEDRTLQLLQCISDNIIKMQKIKETDTTTSTDPNVVELISEYRGNTSKKFSYRVLFIATEMGNTRFVVELIRQYPDLIRNRNDSNQTIFHTAVKHRREGIYNLLYEIGSVKDLLTTFTDIHGNNMLHLVGKSANKNRLEDVSGVALQMQRELLWFKEVEEMTPLVSREARNNKGLTPHELFTNEHKHLVIKGEEWMKGTASQCMVVATLIATIVFAAAFTVPGGYNQNDGIPYFYRKVTFMVFVVADAISLFSSSTSIIIFLSILTSRYAEHDFLESLPKKLMLGLGTLFLSISTMMVAFSVSFFVLYHKDLISIPILITMFATMPVFLFATLQFPLLKDVFNSTYGSRYLFRPKKRVLYRENSTSNHMTFPFKIPFISRYTLKLWKLSQVKKFNL